MSSEEIDTLSLRIYILDFYLESICYQSYGFFLFFVSLL